jgi:hypothetical protein
MQVKSHRRKQAPRHFRRSPSSQHSSPRLLWSVATAAHSPTEAHRTTTTGAHVCNFGQVVDTRVEQLKATRQPPPASL